MNEAQDRKLLEVMDTVARGDLPEDMENDREVREAVETLGLLPYALEPATQFRPLPALPPREAAKTSTPRVLRPEFHSFARPPRWLYAAAAVFVLALIGASTFLALALRDRELQIAHLEGRLSAIGLQDSELVRARVEIGELQRNLRLVTHDSVGICPLRPTEETPSPQGVRGTLYAAGSEGWYLIAEGLRPAADEQAYTVWFLLDDGPRKAGILEVPESGRAELMADGFPEGSRGVIVTLEGSESVQRPEGPEMLFGDAAEMIRL